MKRIICILLILMTFVLPALSEENPFSPYELSAPEGAALEVNESTHTFVRDTARVVVILIPRVPDAEPAEAVLRMMAQFEPDAVLGEDLPLAEGYVGVEAVTTDKYGEGVDQLNVMILSSTGDLLILSGYEMHGDETAAQALLDDLLSSLTVEGALILMNE